MIRLLFFLFPEVIFFLPVYSVNGNIIKETVDKGEDDDIYSL
jgi:hypothetical protein